MKQKLNYKIARFLSLVTKKCNPNMLSYPQLQSVVNSLLFIIEYGKHELHIFEALLSLINLSSRNVSIPYKVIADGLLEENQYIVHACLELVNNMLVNDGQKETAPQNKESSTIAKIQTLVEKYYQHYREMILKAMKKGLDKKSNGNTNDYSHPFKIYCTILSVLMVLDSGPSSNMDKKVVEFSKWDECSKILKFIHDNNGDVASTLFKLVLLHSEKKTLPPNWNIGF